MTDNLGTKLWNGAKNIWKYYSPIGNYMHSRKIGKKISELGIHSSNNQALNLDKEIDKLEQRGNFTFYIGLGLIGLLSLYDGCGTAYGSENSKNITEIENPKQIEINSDSRNFYFKNEVKE